ncbi:MAG: hypothetical protein AB1631_33875 [Acidobacteriota bacterium]
MKRTVTFTIEDEEGQLRTGLRATLHLEFQDGFWTATADEPGFEGIKGNGGSAKAATIDWIINRLALREMGEWT